MLLPTGPLPEDPIAAAAAFHAHWVPVALAALDGGATVLTFVFPPAPHPHTGWREVAVQMLARERKPARINAIATNDPVGIAAAAAFINNAPGLTGQYLVLDSHGADAVLSSPE